MRIRQRRSADESGAVAVLLAIVLTAVMLPLAGYGVTTYLRSGLTAELQRAADAGALAGAARIPLADPDLLRSYIASGVPGSRDPSVLIPPGSCTPGTNCPLDIAVKACEESLNSADQLGNNFVVRDASHQPGCTASYADDVGFLSTFESCVNNLLPEYDDLETPVNVPNRVNAVLTKLGTLTDNLLAQLIPQGLGSLLPALVHPAVRVKAHWAVTGPFDGLVTSNSGGSEHERSAVARRVFKNAVVLPVASLPTQVQVKIGPLALTTTVEVLAPPVIGSGNTIDLNPAVAAQVAQVTSTLDTLESETGSTLQPLGCTGLFAAAKDDMRDLLNPPVSGAPEAETVIEEAADSGEPILTLVVPGDLLEPFAIPFAEFVEVCAATSTTTGDIDLTKAVVVRRNLMDPVSGPGFDFAGCTFRTPGAFRARLVK